MLGVLHHKLIKGCSSISSAEGLEFFKNNCQEIYDLPTMLDTKFRTDAHFTSYSIPGFDMWPRLNKPILPEIRQENHDIVLAYFTFDWDNAGHAEWDQASFDRFSNLITTSQDPIISSWSSVYTTKHGARIVYKISKPVPVDDGEHHLSWMFHHFKEHGFDLIDDSCKDWTRCMRCPQVTRDGDQTWEQEYFIKVYREAELDINLVGKRSPKTVARKTHFVREKQERPDHAVLETLTHGTNRSTGNKVQTEFYKSAKRVLKETRYIDVLFNNAAADWESGHRNEEILLMIGTITPLLLKKCRASISQVFALAIQPLLTLDNDQDWVAHGWNALLDIYEREVAKHNLEKVEKAEKVAREIDVLDKMVEGMKTWCNDPVLWGTDEEKARQFVSENALASVRGFFFMLGEDGYYDRFPLGKDQIVSRIRKTYMENVIATKTFNVAGVPIDITAAALQNEYSTPVVEVQMKPVGDMGGHIEDINGQHPRLILSTFCLNTDLEPTFNEYVNEWLYHLFGKDNFDKGQAWIGNALAFDEGLICALSLEGASSAGKKLLAMGLSECLKDPYIATPDDINGQSSAFTKTPFLIVDESWPTTWSGPAPADKFKSLTGGDGMTVDEKYMPKIRILCPIRMLLTANDDGILRTLTKGKNMGLDNRVAIGERLLHYKVSAKAAAYLRSIGGRGFTARKGQRWIRPDAGADPSDYIVAKHFLWLYHNRKDIDPAQRFLVMGNCAPGGDGGPTTIDRVLSDSGDTPIVSKAIIGMVDADGGQWTKSLLCDPDLTRLWVARDGVHKFVKGVLDERLSEIEVFNAMQNLLVNVEPDTYLGMNMYEVNVELLSDIASRLGIVTSKVKTIFMNRIQGGLRYE